MQTLRYDRGRLAGAAVFGIALLLVFAFLFVAPDALGDSRRGRFLAGGFGHYLFVPLMIVVSGLLAWRAAAMAAGTLEAVSSTSSALFVTGLWGRKRISWNELVSIRLENSGGQRQLAFRTRTGGLFGQTAARISIGLTELQPSRVDEFIENILRIRDGAAPAVSAAAAAPELTPVVGERAFDADAALARYLARKGADDAQVGNEATQAGPSPHLPRRPAFGRKGA